MEPSSGPEGSSETVSLLSKDSDSQCPTVQEDITDNLIQSENSKLEQGLALKPHQSKAGIEDASGTSLSKDEDLGDNTPKKQSTDDKSKLETKHTSEKKSEEVEEMTEEEAQEILMKALQKISPKIGKNFVLRFEDPSTKEVKEISSDKGKLILGDAQLSKTTGGKRCPIEKEVKGTSVEEGVTCDEGPTSTSSTQTVEKKQKMEITPIKRTPRTATVLKNLAKKEEEKQLQAKNTPVYYCENCPSAFGTRGNLNKHVRMKHGLGLEMVNDSDENNTLENEDNDSMSEDGNPESQNDLDTSADTTAAETPNVTEKKRGRGRPPKNKSCKTTEKGDAKEPNVDKDTSMGNGNTPKRGRGRPKKSKTSPPAEVPAKRAKISYTDDDITCFLNILDDEQGFSCKLCSMKLDTSAIAKVHVVSEHRKNLQQCTKTLDKFPDGIRTCRWDNLIYISDDTGIDDIMPTEIFSTPGRAGRKRTPSTKLLESQAASLRKYACKVCHKKGASKSNILQHMKKYHSDLLPQGDEEITEEEEVPNDEEEGAIEEEDLEMEVEEGDSDEDYKPSLHIVDRNSDYEDNPKPSKQAKTLKSIKTEKGVGVIKTEKGEDNVENSGMEDSVSDVESKKIKVEKKPLKYINNRAKSRVYRKVPSYYIYCDHGEDEIEKRPPHDLPFCKSCDRFKCLTCTLTFNKSCHVNRHIRIVHHKEKKYICDKCDARFTTNESLQYHNKWHIGVKDVACPHCDMKFLVQKNLRKHMRKHHPGLDLVRRKKTNVCELCKSQFTRKERLEYHMLEKHPANNPDMECRICGQKFETEEQCTEHSNAHADLKKMPVAKCPHCPLYCSSKNNLKRHVDRVHLNIKKYLCTTCGKRFKGHDAFVYHMKRHADPHGRDYECHICNKKIASEKGLEIHLRVHSGIKPYVCETCGRGFAQKGNMLSHQAVHFDDRPFECSECKKTFKKKFDLFKHMKRHRIKHVVETGDTSVLKDAGKIYECPVSECGGLFCSNTDLRLHLRKHNNEKPFECEICFKTFAVKSRLVRHLRNVHLLQIPECDLDIIKTAEYAEKLEMARENYEERKKKYQTVMIPQPSGEQIEVQIMTEDTEGVEDLLALSNAAELITEKPDLQVEGDKQGDEIQLKIETSEEEGSKVQIINVQDDGSGQVQIHTDDDNIVLDPAIIQTLLNSGQQTIYYYVDQ